MISTSLLAVLMVAFTHTLAWRPFLDPLDLHHIWWLLLVPLAFVIGLVYKTLKLRTLDTLWPQTMRLTAIIVVFMIGIAAILWVIIELVPARG